MSSSCRTLRVIVPKNTLLLAAGILLTLVAGACGGDADTLKIGLLIDETRAHESERQSFDLAIEHLNRGGGVFGRPIQVVVGDIDSHDVEKTVAAARRLVEEDGVHVMVGPGTSAGTIAVVERVTGPAGIPTISPSATSPMLTTVVDDDFLFRTTLSDSAQGPVLARVVRDQGVDNVGVIYLDDPWGQGLAGAFEAAWDGPIRSVPIDHEQTSFLPQLRQTAEAGAQILVVLTFPDEAAILIREAIDDGIYGRFAFGDGAQSEDLVQTIGGGALGGMYGTAPAFTSGSPSSDAWDAAFREAHGSVPKISFVKELYDAVIALALAAQAASAEPRSETSCARSPNLRA